MNDIETSECTDASCPAHNRVDRKFEVVDGLGSAVTYVGDHVVVTAISERYLQPLYASLAAFLIQHGRNVPNLYETCVYFVGSGSLADSAEDGKIKPIRVQHSEMAEQAAFTHNGMTLWYTPSE